MFALRTHRLPASPKEAMKRRSQKRVVRDREMEQLKALTTLSLSRQEMRDRLLADKTALEARLKELFWRRRNRVESQDTEDAVRGISAELRRIKVQLQQ